MSTTFETIAQQAMQLSAEERDDLADRLWMSVHAQEDINDAWDAEVRKRIAQIDSGEAEFIPWETVVARQRERLKKRSG